MPSGSITCPQCGFAAEPGEFIVYYTDPPMYGCPSCKKSIPIPGVKGPAERVLSGEEGRKKRPEMYGDDE